MRDNVSHLPGAARFRRGRGPKREHLVTWPTQTGWAVMVDRWVPNSNGQLVRSVETRTFSNRNDALRALRVRP